MSCAGSSSSRALGQHDAAGGQEVPDAVEPRLAVDVVEVVAFAVAGRAPGTEAEEAVEELLPGVLVHHRGGRQDAVEVKEDGGGAGERSATAGGVGNSVMVDGPFRRRVV